MRPLLTFLAATAVCALAPAAAAGAPGCSTNGDPILITSPDALGQAFTLPDDAVIAGVDVNADAVGGVTGAISITRLDAKGAPAGPDLVRAPAPADVDDVLHVTFAPIALAAGAYAIVLEPASGRGYYAWHGCGDTGALYRSALAAWQPIPQHGFAYAVAATPIDRTAPTTTIEPLPPFVRATEVAVRFAANEPATFDCALDGGGYASCTSPFVVAGEGSHAVDVRARDATGNVEGAPARATFALDTTPPVLTLAAEVPARAGDPVSLPGAVTDALDPAPSVLCTPPLGSPLAVGDTTVTCVGRDAAGNEASAAFVVHARARADRAELQFDFDPDHSIVDVSEAAGGDVTIEDGLISGAVDGHTILANREPVTVIGGQAVERGWYVKLLRYEGTRVRAQTGSFGFIDNGSGATRQITVVARAEKRLYVAHYDAATDTTTLRVTVVSSGRVVRSDRVQGAVTYRLRTNAGRFVVERP